MKKKISLVILVIFVSVWAQNDSLNVFTSPHLENYFLQHTNSIYRQNNLSSLLSRKEYLEYKLNHTPYINDITLFKNIVDYVPINFIDRYYINDIYLMSFFNFVDLKINLQNPEYLKFNIPLDRWNVNRKNFWKPSTYFKSWFSKPEGEKNVKEK
ncbi:MAG TPA: hypothetical protein DHM37_08005 [Candidatus Cloacimonas sp.]|nr:hypothetical protein [Candidatus Cloacimonas sp.]